MNYGSKIIRNKDFLKQPNEPASLEEGVLIGEHLKRVLAKVGGVGLAAPQVGIHKRVCIIHAKKNSEPIVLINPRVTASISDKILFFEGCLSLPRGNYTVRNKSITVAADNLPSEIEFKPEQELTDEQYKKGDHLISKIIDEGLLESVAAQHELDHLDGILITDPSVKVILNRPVRTPIKYGRNDKVMVKNPKTQDTQRVKYKKIQPLLDAGWEII